MFENYQLKEFDLRIRSEALKVIAFLTQNGLKYEAMKRYVAFCEQEEIIAGGGYFNNVIKCVAVNEKAREQNLINGLISRIRKIIFDNGYANAFVFTKPQYEKHFKSLAFYAVGRGDKAVLLESDKEGISRYCAALSQLKKDGLSGGVVVNCNPITKGHLYLIQEASKRVDCLHIFVVKEDQSVFRYADRFALIKEAVKDLNNIVLHEGSEYIISAATFPSYFLKDDLEIAVAQMQLDLNIFGKKIAPALNITKRFIGSESEIFLVNYNALMQKELPSYGIDCVEIPRKTYGGEVISASRVRALFAQGRLEEIKPLVPPCTYEFLASSKSDYAKKNL